MKDKPNFWELMAQLNALDTENKLAYHFSLMKVIGIMLIGLSIVTIAIIKLSQGG